METAVIKVTRYRSPDGLPTCSANVTTGEVCRFYGLRRMGSVSVCMLGEQRDLSPLGYHYQRPDAKCEVWSAEDSEDKLRTALELIAAPMRADGTYNRCRAACQDLAVNALSKCSEGDAL
jgi:hypothetical protein